MCSKLNVADSLPCLCFPLLQAGASIPQPPRTELVIGTGGHPSGLQVTLPLRPGCDLSHVLVVLNHSLDTMALAAASCRRRQQVTRGWSLMTLVTRMSLVHISTRFWKQLHHHQQKMLWIVAMEVIDVFTHCSINQSRRLAMPMAKQRQAKNTRLLITLLHMYIVPAQWAYKSQQAVWGWTLALLTSSALPTRSYGYTGHEKIYMDLSE